MSLIPVLPTLIPGILPPSRETWEWASLIMSYFPYAACIQFVVPFFGMGKASIVSPFNIPGKIAWITMEVPTILVGAYIANTLPSEVGLLGGFDDLPGPNKLLIALYLLHYANRALITPIFLTPSQAPIHFVPWISSVMFNSLNATQLIGWAAGYGPTDRNDWYGGRIRIQLGLMIFALGLCSNVLHEDELREIRRQAKREQIEKERKAVQKGEGKDGEKPERVYKIPQTLGFSYILYPHYLSEWIEWAGYWLIGGASFVQARTFLLNEIVVMTFQAVSGKKWYIEKFGKENVGDKKAVIPFVL